MHARVMVLILTLFSLFMIYSIVLIISIHNKKFENPFIGTLLNSICEMKAEMNKKGIKLGDKSFDVSEHLWRTTFDAIFDAVCLLDLDGKIIICNKAMAELVGKTSEEIVGHTCWKLIHGTERRFEDCPVIKMKKSLSRESLITKLGDKWFHVTADPLFADNGELIGCVHVVRDITERKLAEDRLRESEELYRNLVERANDGIAIIQDELIKYANNRIADLGGYPIEELLDTPFANYFSPEEIPKVLNRYRLRMAGEDVPTVYESVIRTADGSEIFVEINAATTTYKGRPADQVILRDITERKRIEENMRRRLMKFDLKEGRLYLVKESYPTISLEAIKDLLKVGYRCLVISRSQKELFRNISDKNCEFLYLGEDGEQSIPPEFEELESKIKSMPNKTVIFLDRLDYLVFKKGFEQSLAFIQRLKDYTYFSELIVLLSVDPDTMGGQQIGQVEKETVKLEIQDRIRLPEDLFEVLKYIYQRNNTGIRPIYTDISKDLKISKPTVMSKVKQLVSRGYVTSNVKGRTKVVELTEKGWSLFLQSGK